MALHSFSLALKQRLKATRKWHSIYNFAICLIKERNVLKLPYVLSRGLFASLSA